MTTLAQYGVMGNPIAHSQSPFIHNEFAKQTQQAMLYQAILVQRNGFAQAVRDFQANGGQGLNITTPFKQEAWHLMTVCSERAAAARAVNTIVMREDGTLWGDNTDGIGMIRDLYDKQIAMYGKKILILGAGGATYGIVSSLLNEKPLSITIANRTLQKAQEVVKAFSEYTNLIACELSELVDPPFDVVIHATSAGVQKTHYSFNPEILHAATCCYDLSYGPAAESFLGWARNNGVDKCYDGWGMLVEQAAEAFYIWRGVRPDTRQIQRPL